MLLGDICYWMANCQYLPCLALENHTTSLLFSAGATTSELQRFSGCRLHLDRESCAVRIFGPEEVVATAEKLLDKLAEACAEHLLNVTSDDLDEEQFVNPNMGTMSEP